MSYEEKGAWVYLAATVGTFVAYAVVVTGRAAHTPIAGVSYAAPLLWTIGIAVGASIAGRVLVEIARPGDEHRPDVRDREIGRFGEYVGGVVLGFAMLVPFGLALAESDPFWIANAMYGAFVLSTLVGTTIKLVAYRRGL